MAAAGAPRAAGCYRGPVEPQGGKTGIQCRVKTSLRVRTISIISQKTPAPTNTQVSRLLYRTCMKYNTTSVAFETAMVMATMAFK